MKPEFSVIIPVYNRQHSIEVCIDSVLEQTFPPKEIIVVDDGSTDDTAKILNNYKNKITVITLTQNFGVSKARNTGIQSSQYPWIAFLDSDDQWKVNKLASDANFIMSNPSYQLFQSQEIWYRNGVLVNKKKYHIQPEGWIFEKCLERCMISPSSVVLHRSLFTTYGHFDEAFPVCEDYDLWLRLTRYVPCGLVPSATVIKYGGHADQLSCRYPAMDRFRIRALEKLLTNEKDPHYSQLIQKELERKRSIFLQGALKRRR